MRKLDSNAHSVFLLYYHLILVIKYRKKVLTDPISDRAKEIFEYIASNYHITLEEWQKLIKHLLINGIMIGIMCTLCSVLIRNRNLVSSLMHTKVQAADCSRKSIRRSGKSCGRKCSGARVFVC